MLYRTQTKTKRVDAVLVLGSRIFGDRVPPLLAARLDAAIQIHTQQLRTGAEPPLLICCGGQGDDEIMPEAVAMANYLREHDVPAEVIRVEDASRTTEENLVFGARIAAVRNQSARLLITTNDYHTFRAALLTRKLGLNAQVIGAKTASYYRPAAFLREYLAILRDYAWGHAWILVAFVLLVGALLFESLQQR